MANLKSISINGKSIFDIIYPVGSIYQTMDSSFNPSTAFGGTWSRIKGRVLVGVDENDSTFKSAKLTGGEKSHWLSIHETPSHTHALEPNGSAHSFSWGANKGTVYVNADAVGGASPSGTNRLYTRQNEWNQTGASGSTQPHNNLQPYITCYIWERTA